ncbi:MAG: murein DD-endopeptidase MepM/ murein hydrolase activator NlpD [Lentisphaeria bacterium]|jgi:murein DD-endopeptidase MepM/ murein hydrolase activator NlpD
MTCIKNKLGLAVLLAASVLCASSAGVFAQAEQKHAVPAAATPIQLDIVGEWTQGGLLTGTTASGNTVTILGKHPSVASDGRFVFGLGRDAPPTVKVHITSSDGSETALQYTVKQRSYDIQRIEGVEQKYVTPAPEVTARIQAEAALVWRARQQISDANYFREGFLWPLIGEVTGVYGSQRVFNGVPKRPHFGLDIAGPVGAQVTAPAAGIVTLVHTDMYYSGGTLLIDHGQGVSSTFIHLSKVLVRESEKVARGQLIAEVGATGRATGPHLDWRINWFDQRLDPFLLLPNTPYAQ